MSKRIPDLTLHTPIAADSLVIYDSVADTTNRTLVSNLISTGISGLIMRALSANATGTDVSTAQPWFPTTGGATLQSSTTYFLEGTLRTSRAAGAVSHTTSLLFGGTATLTSIEWQSVVNTGDVVTNLAANQTTSEVATATVVKAASTSTTEQISIQVKGIVRINAGGTFIPQFQYSAAPGGAPSILSNSYFKLYPVGTGGVTSIGTWS